MGSKIGVILSTIFVIMAFLLGCDLISVQYIYSDLDAKSVNISYLISRSVTIDYEFVNKVKDRYNVNFTPSKYGVPAFGEEINYTLSYDYKPLMISSESVTVSINRYVIVGFYG